MNKAELVEEIARESGLSKRVCQDVTDAITSVIIDALARGERVTLVGFGSFRVMTRKERRGRNPQTGQQLQIPAKDVPKFEPGKNLREMVA